MTKTSWVSSKLEIKTAGRKGMGTFTSSFIKKDEILIVQGGVIAAADLFRNPQFDAIAYHCFQVERDVYICPLDHRKETADGVFLVNHSCNPTCGFRGQITLVSRRDLMPGDEVTYDYAMTDVGVAEEKWLAMKCFCGSTNCRKFITGDDWEIPDLQKNYQGYFSTYVQAVIDAKHH